jgi:sigma-B regulation protein RsbU (phosphoserine phosphatase)
MALGVIEPFEFISAEITLAQEDALFLFTDGVTEAYDPAQLLYGEARLEQLLRTHGTRDAETMIRQVSSEIQAFVRDQEQADDMTMLSVVYLGRSRDGHAQAA